MRIAQISTPHEPTPPPTSGGIERVAATLAEGLAARGHDVVLYATGDSTASVPLRATVERAERPYSLARETVHLTRAWPELGRFDLVHNHCLLGTAYAPLAPPGVPVVSTLHWTFDTSYQPLVDAFPTGPYIALSEWQRRAMPHLSVVAVIPNSVDLNEYPFEAQKDGFLLFIGRIDPRKGPHLAVQAARRVGARLVLAGKLKAENRPYFEREIAPHLDDRTCYVGEVGGAERLRLFSRARGLLFPIQWDEPFGLVMIEAMACGTPVVALDRASTPEVVASGETGFVAPDFETFTAAIPRLAELDPAACRRRVAECYSNPIVLDAHEALFRRLVGVAR